MSESIVVALIAGACGIIAQLVIGRQTRKDLWHELDKHQAVTDTKLDELTREVRAHNNFANRIPVIEEQIKVANHRIDDLERSRAS